MIVILTMPTKYVKKRLKARHPKKEDKMIVFWLEVTPVRNSLQHSKTATMTRKIAP